MEAITIGQIIEFLGVLAGVIGSIGVIWAAIHKCVHKVVSREKEAVVSEIKQQLNEISNNQKELKEQSKELRDEIILVMKLNQAMTKELQTLGHPNGETTAALNDLNNYLLNK